ncbi:SH3 domain-containing protein [Streptomyces sp. HUAS TT20]|uniref:SH3 domain-containing protein n=1 Tax=Streptomyces sp. HUAS TT20 TaxID=3447509 RepID=UPI0021DAB90C|nr:SH3 domain-containing protein [Streptomyces sp. HUAS 15-9]UXY29464.1 SH3 domain-containing protein [Streptomyces sp. HUAS 15-9]
MLATHPDEWLPGGGSGDRSSSFESKGISITGRKALRSLVVSGALVAGVGLVGVSSASAVIPDPGYSAGRSGGTAVTHNGGPYKAIQNDGPYKTATVNGLRVRTGAGTNRTILGLVYRGQRVRVMATARDHRGQRWDKVRLQKASPGGLPRGFTGWVSEMYLY